MSVIFRPTGEGVRYDLFGYTSVFKALAADTGGHFSLTESHVPAGYTARPHRHTKQLELFYLLNGELDFTIDDRRSALTTGSTLIVPPQVVHSFQNRREEPARLLALWSPGGFEHCYAEWTEAFPDGASFDRDRFDEIWRRHGAEPAD